MDPLVVAVVILILVPVAVVWALSKSAALRGPAPRPNPSKPVEALVTDVIPEERPEEDELEHGAPQPDEDLTARPFRRPAGSPSERGLSARGED